MSEHLSEKQIAEIAANVKEAHNHSIETMLKHNSKAIPDTFSKHFRAVGGDWRFGSRDEIVRALETGTHKYKSIKSKIDHVDVQGSGLALVTDRREVHAEIKGTPFEAEFKNTTVYGLEDGKWKVVLWGPTPL